MKKIFRKNKHWFPKRSIFRFNKKILTYPIPQFVKVLFGPMTPSGISPMWIISKEGFED